jgi:hypothetical protein
MLSAGTSVYLKKIVVFSYSVTGTFHILDN